MAGKPCDRCGAFDGGGSDDNPYNEEFGEQEEEKEPAMCAEVHVAFGLVSWLCHNCRKEYHRFAKNHHLNRQYGEAAMRLEFWKARVGPETPPDALDEGLAAWGEVEDLELKINESANHWLISDPDEVRVN